MTLIRPYRRRGLQLIERGYLSRPIRRGNWRFKFRNRECITAASFDSSSSAMSTERPACGLSSLLPTSCRGRAEAFARRLQSRLQTLGRPADNGDTNVVDESSWLAPKTIATTQPRLSSSSDSDLYFDFDVEPTSPASPVEEPADLLVNQGHQTRDPESGFVLSSSSPSPGSESSDGPYFDLENPDHESKQNISTPVSHRNCNGHVRVDNENKCSPDPEKESRTSSSHVPGNPEQMCNETYPVLAEPSGSYCSTFCRPSNLCIQCPVQYKGNQEVCDLLSVTTGTPTSEDIADSSPENHLCSDRFNDTTSINIKQLLKKGFSEEEMEEEDSAVRDDLKGTEEVTVSVDSSLIIDLSSLSVEQSNDTGNFVARDIHAEEEKNDSKNYPADEVFSKTEANSSSSNRSNDTDEDDDAAPQRLRRCTSLKSGKTPPGTPGRKKIVRFADVLGLDLADVRTFLDEVPRIPSSAYSDLRDADLSLGSSAMPVIGSMNTQLVPVEPTKCLVPLFQQPGGQPDFMQRVRERQVCLENAVVKDPVMFRIEGTVRVRNLDFHKSVHIRYTLDGWSSFADLQATYISNSCDGFSDKFCFVLYAHTLVIGQRLEFAVRFQCKGCQFWDSNQGANYTFQCLPPTSSTPYLPLGLSSPEDRWAAFY